MDTQSIKPKVTPRDFFLWLGAMVALYASVIWTIFLLHAYINYYFPDPTQYDDPAGLMRISIAFLVVTVPLFIYLLRLVHQDIRSNEIKRELWVRRWLVVLTLFIAGVTIAADLVTLIYYFLQGELTTRFLLKAATFVLLPGAAFWYFMEELRGTWEKKKKLSETIGLSVVVSLAVLIVGSFMIMGSPFTQRLIQLDDQRINDLRSLQDAIVTHYQQTGAVPESLDALKNPLGYFVIPTDPETHEPYVYEKVGPLEFRVCATFSTEGDETSRYPNQSKPVEEGWYRFAHGIGETCFDRPIDPNMYPLFDSNQKEPQPTIMRAQ